MPTIVVRRLEETVAQQRYAQVLAREQAGRPIRAADAQIASIRRAHGTCMTHDVEQLAGTGVGVLDPWAA